MKLNLSREQCFSIKGYGIFLIFIHNFFTNVLEIKCNEAFYAQENTTAFLNSVISESFLGELFGFVGWIGVPLFFFMSGYGLSKKYQHTDINGYSFIKSHIIKLWKLLIPVFLIYVIIDYFAFGHYHSISKTVIPLITFTSNILRYNQNEFYIDPGVYWFFGAILQFYILFLVLRKLKVKQLTILFFVFFVIQYLSLFFLDEAGIRWIKQTFIGWGAPFTLGMILAQSPEINLSKGMNIVVIIASLALLCLSLLTKIFSPLAQIATVILAVSLVQFKCFKPSVFLGVISSSVFVIHPLVRLFFLNLLDCKNHIHLILLCYIVLTLLVSWVHHRILTRQKILTRK